MTEDNFIGKYEKVIRVLKELTHYCKAVKENYEAGIEKIQNQIITGLYKKIIINGLIPKRHAENFINYSKAINNIFIDSKKCDEELWLTAKKLQDCSISLDNILKIQESERKE
ncbi:hypothetical protein COS83_04835 [archaeon CG07_land_8_20_14_0_80_38_8]|nr:MAG: hypothetical protein COS83_04835 [archaeon CG07_land_8_20_14_0_80_38_8]PIU89590.1 MAG: hypothetical protein COS64_00695 [archaeon CG06_land_8_20_14_3_00_37_11]